MDNETYLELNKKISELYKNMGYSNEPLYEYKEPDEDLMDYNGYSEHAKKFNLKKSDVYTIMKVITESAAYQRTSQKSMMATKSNTVIPPDEISQIFRDSEALVQTRQTHMREVADIARIISNALGLNTDFAYLIGLLHDIGHTWNGHTGERILSVIGRLNNCGYIVHNAMGSYILERENIITRAIEEVKQFNPNAKKDDIEEFMRYIIDGVVSHNGEGIIGKILPKDKTSEEMAEEIRKCFTEKGFDRKIMPATMEGAVIRYADIIAYTRSDILDGFRLKDTNGNKIIDKFDDEYLSIIGTVLARKNNYTELLTLENKFLQEMYGLSKKIDSLSSIDNNSILLQDKIELDRTKKELEFIQEKYKEFEECKIKYAKEYIDRIEPESEVKTVVTQMMQNEFIKDLIEASKDKGYITMTPLMRRTFFTLRDLNVRKIVPYTRRIFEAEELPVAANQLVDDFTEILVKTGIAYNVLPEDVKSQITPKYTSEEQKNEEREIYNDRELTYERKLCHYYRKQNAKNLEYIYKNVVDAMEDITKHDIAIALGEEIYDQDLKSIYESSKINPIRVEIRKMGKTSEMMSEQDKEVLLQNLLRKRRQNIERAVASKMAIEYISGMTDNTILSVLIEKNLILRKQLIDGYGRAEPGKQAIDPGVVRLQNLFSKNDSLINPDKGDEGLTL